MTFKHTKFEDSPTMRSLEKLSLQKGLTKIDIFQKLASRNSIKKADLTPTDNFTENLMKLCAGLREAGLDKYANELESTFIIYKNAENLYNTSKEDGEDLIDAAHPKGSYKLDNVDGDSIIETIIDQQLQDLKIVEKKPSGKLSNASSIISTVKVILADNSSNQISELQQQIISKLNRISEIMNRFFELANEDLTLKIIKNNTLKLLIEALKTNLTKEKLLQIIPTINTFSERVSPSWMGGVSPSTWEKIKSLPAMSIQLTNDALQLMDKINEIKKQQIEAPFQSNVQTSDSTVTLPEVQVKSVTSFVALRGRIATAVRKLNSWQSIVNTYEDNNDVTLGTQFISSKINQLQKIERAMDNVDPEDAEGVAPRFEQQLKSIEAELVQFYDAWIK